MKLAVALLSIAAVYLAISVVLCSRAYNKALSAGRPLPRDTGSSTEALGQPLTPAVAGALSLTPEAELLPGGGTDVDASGGLGSTLLASRQCVECH